MGAKGQICTHEANHPRVTTVVKKVGPPVISEQVLLEAKAFLNGKRPSTTDHSTPTTKPES